MIANRTQISIAKKASNTKGLMTSAMAKEVCSGVMAGF